MSDKYILLKWGTVKGWGGLDNKSLEILQRWGSIGYSLSAMMQHDTPEQKDILCELIEQFDGEIQNDWSGENLTKEQAVAYVRNYGKETA